MRVLFLFTSIVYMRVFIKSFVKEQYIMILGF